MLCVWLHVSNFLDGHIRSENTWSNFPSLPYSQELNRWVYLSVGSRVTLGDRSQFLARTYFPMKSLSVAVLVVAPFSYLCALIFCIYGVHTHSIRLKAERARTCWVLIVRSTGLRRRPRLTETGHPGKRNTCMYWQIHSSVNLSLGSTLAVEIWFHLRTDIEGFWR